MFFQPWFYSRQTLNYGINFLIFTDFKKTSWDFSTQAGFIKSGWRKATMQIRNIKTVQFSEYFQEKEAKPILWRLGRGQLKSQEWSVMM